MTKQGKPYIPVTVLLELWLITIIAVLIVTLLAVCWSVDTRRIISVPVNADTVEVFGYPSDYIPPEP